MISVKKPIILPRYVCDSSEDSAYESKLVDKHLLEKYRSTDAWVLLGEPGSGKSTALAHEASLSGGVYLSITEFISDEIDLGWQDKTLFLDGLDEIRASSKHSDIPVISRISARLKKLGSPSFRLSCRAADWQGLSDTQVLAAVSSSKTIKVLQLEPLSSDDIHTLLKHNYEVSDAKKFMEIAHRFGVDELLNNPQTLELLAQSIRGDQWPNSRDKVYQLACEKMVDEAARSHRNILRVNIETFRSTENRLDAAGQLCAVLLLSDQSGLALDTERENSYFMRIEQCAPADVTAATQAVGSKLFRPQGEERLVPCHRSVAEYLAAKWLAKQLDQRYLPQGRIFNLLLGLDGRAVAGLRGLYGWLALHSQTARQQLIQADVMAVVLYGDPKPMPTNDKRQILQQLQRETENPSDFRAHYSSPHSFVCLLDPALEDDFKIVLQSKDRSNKAQAYLDCVVDMFFFGEPMLALMPLIYALIIDETYWPGIRGAALNIWLRYEQNPEPKIALLNEIQSGAIHDDDDELAAKLLEHLYPRNLEPAELLNYFHKPKKSNVIGSFDHFWRRRMVDMTSDEYLPVMMDTFFKPLLARDTHNGYFPTKSFVELLSRTLEVVGERVDDERLLAWLQLYAEYQIATYDRGTAYTNIVDWFKRHPQRYKAQLTLCYQDIDSFTSFQINKPTGLEKGSAPMDLGLWHLQQMSLTNETSIKKSHLEESVDILMNYPQSAIGLDLDDILMRVHNDVQAKDWLEGLLVCAYPNWHTQSAARARESDAEKTKTKKKHTQEITNEIVEIALGVAEPHTMYLLAGVQEQLFSDIQGDTAQERFNDFVSNGDRVHIATEQGLKRCPERSDIPSVEEVFTLYKKNEQSYLHIPCLVGMAMRYDEAPASILALSQQTLQSIIAFYFVHSGKESSAWMDVVAANKPEWVAEVMIGYINMSLQARKHSINGIYKLETQPEYKEVAKIVAPQILKQFPLRANTNFLYTLKRLLKIGIRYCASDIRGLLEIKLSKKSMSVTQTIYWLATGLLLDSNTYEQQVWCYIERGDSHKKTTTLADFFSNDFKEIDDGGLIPVQSLGRLIEALALSANMRYDSEDGTITDSHRRGDNIKSFIGRLETSNTSDAIQEINRLLSLAATKIIHDRLALAHNELLNRQREQQFTFLSGNEVANIINNKAPANAADLLALTSDTLNDIAIEIRRDNDNGYKGFWNIEPNKPIKQRVEDQCREILLLRLRYKLQSYNIDCQPEGYCVNSSRSDIRLSYQNDFELPVEIKRDSNSALWTAIQRQLIDKYTVAPKCDGHGIYLVLWFGGQGLTMAGSDGGVRPKSAQELQRRLKATIKPHLQSQIAVHVIDVSWP